MKIIDYFYLFYSITLLILIIFTNLYLWNINLKFNNIYEMIECLNINFCGNRFFPDLCCL